MMISHTNAIYYWLGLLFQVSLTIVKCIDSTFATVILLQEVGTIITIETIGIIILMRALVGYHIDNMFYNASVW